MTAVAPAEASMVKDLPVVADLAGGTPVVLYDRTERAATLVIAAATASPDVIAFAVRHGSGLLAVALPEQDCDLLGLPRMIGAGHRSSLGDARVTVDAAEGISTGISATDRARTIRLLGRPETAPDDLQRPGHVMTTAVPASCCSCGQSPAPSIAGVALKLVRTTGLHPAAALTHLVHPDSAELLDYHDTIRFGHTYGLQVADSLDVLNHS
ncbi:3,4-dihydroxy-2-butanone 4-phosphate synthase [Prauserella sediminis]|uniref:3,4-dihydroxy-2-butanone-4-phosphate synthase n=1 Tax=Prauserella sediminis TaxID=577680 RepID=A0A839XPD1_9PSEU|nr:3,4-dihydroxy-2-butanone-4-phosphate synthase [Prauserella sediminis]MBB3664537.1 3,4-dihydroxy-2-butanone 4-phosphate synthase [Prauserella sediminis]